MRAIIVGMGVQGRKRKKILGKEAKYTVDRFKKAEFKSIYDVPLKEFDTAFICVPDLEKLKIVNYCVENGKNVLLEKPFINKNTKALIKIEKLAIKKKVILYTAYNHRFEPSIIKMQKLIKSNQLGKIYKCKIFYGNGTSLLVKKSKWRDKGKGVLIDIGSHLLDICIFWFGKNIKNLKTLEISKFENKSSDYATVSLKIDNINILLEMTLCMWKNTFTCDLLGLKGSAHINSLGKWSKNYFSYRKRKFPSGIPFEKKTFFKHEDPTWKLELLYFKKLIKKKIKTNLKKDILLNKLFSKFK